MNTEEKLKMELDKLSLEENDVVVLKFDTSKCCVFDLNEYMNILKKICPNPVIALAENMEIGAQNIDSVIEYLNAMRKS